MYKTIRRALALLIAVALTATLAACASKSALPTPQQFSSSPTEAEIAEFRRTHAPNGGGGGSGQSDSTGEYTVMTDRISTANMKNGHDVVLTVEVIGEREDRDLVTEVGTTRPKYCYRVKVIDVLMLNPDSTNYTDYQIDDEVYIMSSPSYAVDMRIGETYCVVGGNSHHSGNPVLEEWEKTTVFMWNDTPVILCVSNNVYYYTENSYVIETIEESKLVSHTGETVEEFTESIIEVGEELGWNIEPSAPETEEKVIADNAEVTD
jgi:hypothetical protein